MSKKIGLDTLEHSRLEYLELRVMSFRQSNRDRDDILALIVEEFTANGLASDIGPKCLIETVEFYLDNMELLDIGYKRHDHTNGKNSNYMKR